MTRFPVDPTRIDTTPLSEDERAGMIADLIRKVAEAEAREGARR